LATLAGLIAVAAALAAAPQARAQGTGLPAPGTQNAAQLDMARSIDRMCPNLNPQDPGETGALARTCTNIVTNSADLDQESLNGVLQSLNGEELQAAQQQVGEISDVQIGNITARLSAIRAGLAGPGLSVAGLNVLNGGRVLALDDSKDLQIVPAQFGEDGFLSRLGIFATGNITFGDKDSTGELEGFDFDTEGLTIGADYRLTDSLVLGAAVGYSRFNAEFDDSIDSPDGQELDSDAVQFSLFGSFYPIDRLFVDAVASVGWHFYDSERQILAPSDDPGDPELVRSNAKGDFDAIHYGVAANVGYTIQLLGANVTPIARLEYLRAEIDGFTEDSPAAIELEFDDSDAESLPVNLGIEADYPISTPFGVIAPNIRAEYVHDFLTDDDGVLVRYAADTTQLSEFEVSTEDEDEDYGILGAGIAATLPAGWAAFVDYHTFVGLTNFTIHAVNVGFRKEF
jgi:outer membrane lipase/esterase